MRRSPILPPNTRKYFFSEKMCFFSVQPLKLIEIAKYTYSTALVLYNVHTRTTAILMLTMNIKQLDKKYEILHHDIFMQNYIFVIQNGLNISRKLLQFKVHNIDRKK